MALGDSKIFSDVKRRATSAPSEFLVLVRHCSISLVTTLSQKTSQMYFRQARIDFDNFG